MRTCDCVSSFFDDSIGFFSREEVSCKQKTAAVVALFLLTLCTGGIFLIVEARRHCLNKRKITLLRGDEISEPVILKKFQTLHGNSYIPLKRDTPPDVPADLISTSSISSVDFSANIPSTDKTTKIPSPKEGTSKDGDYTTNCYELIEAQGWSGFRSDDFKNKYPRDTMPVIVPRLGFFDSAKYSSEDLDWIAKIIIYAGGMEIAGAKANNVEAIIAKHFCLYIELVMLLDDIDRESIYIKLIQILRGCVNVVLPGVNNVVLHSGDGVSVFYERCSDSLNFLDSTTTKYHVFRSEMKKRIEAAGLDKVQK